MLRYVAYIVQTSIIASCRSKPCFHYTLNVRGEDQWIISWMYPNPQTRVARSPVFYGNLLYFCMHIILLYVQSPDAILHENYYFLWISRIFYFWIWLPLVKPHCSRSQTMTAEVFNSATILSEKLHILQHWLSSISSNSQSTRLAVAIMLIWTTGIVICNFLICMTLLSSPSADAWWDWKLVLIWGVSQEGQINPCTKYRNNYNKIEWPPSGITTLCLWNDISLEWPPSGFITNQGLDIM